MLENKRTGIHCLGEMGKVTQEVAICTGVWRISRKFLGEKRAFQVKSNILKKIIMSWVSGAHLLRQKLKIEVEARFCQMMEFLFYPLGQNFLISNINSWVFCKHVPSHFKGRIIFVTISNKTIFISPFWIMTSFSESVL